jgi:tetratricopeptide (TPR) repeat protein
MSAPENRLLRRLREGAGADDAELRQRLELTGEVPDRELARALVREITSQTLARVKVSRETDRDGRSTAAPELMAAPDSSFLGRLATTAEDDDERVGVAELEDVHTLLAVLRAGTLPQRRAAALRLGARLDEGDLSNEEVRAVSTTLLNVRDVEIAFEVSHAREALPGARGRAARQETEAFEKVLEGLVEAIDDFWAGQSETEPVSALPPDQRAQLMVRLRDAPDVVLHHIASVLDGSDGASSRTARLALLSSVRYSGDPRLTPPLAELLAGRQAELVPEAARALARIDDPRVHPALAAAYERSVVDAERTTLAGTLGLVGDVRGRDYVRSLLASDDERVLLAAVEAMEALATSEDCERLIPLLERSDPVLLTHVIRAIGRTGDARGLPPLAQLRRESGMSALWADAEDGEAAIRALMELRGEEVPEFTETVQLASASASGAAERKRDPIVVRLSSWFDFVIGHVWLAMGAARRAVSRFERAAGRRPGWAAPLAALALHYARGDRPPQALAAFRRALEADRGWVEKNVYAIRTLARIFLRRAEEVEKSGRVDIARGLIEEVLSLDLRRVPSELRFELSRRQEQLRMRSAA